MYDLHTHSIVSDGEMLPAELVRRMAVLGYKTVAVTDHVDRSNIRQVIQMLSAVRGSAQLYGLNLLSGVEITHVPPQEIAGMAQQAKEAGADIVIVHGETPVEPVAPGTNRAACSCRHVDVLAHPGMITGGDARRAAANGIALEITSRGGHNRTNGHIVNVAREADCLLVVNSDAHAPHDLLDDRARELVARGAGLTAAEAQKVLALDIGEWLGS